MTEQERRAQVKREMIRVIQNGHHCSYDQTEDNCDEGYGDCDECFAGQLLAQFLALRDSDGEPMVMVRDTDQSGPETETCWKCEGEGNIYADGKAHYYTEHSPTIPCPKCGGLGHSIAAPEDYQAADFVKCLKPEEGK